MTFIIIIIIITSRIPPFDPSRLQNYNCSRQRFIGLPIFLLSCGLYWYDFKGFGFVAFFARVKASSDCIRLSCLVCIQSVVHGIRIHLFCGHNLQRNAFISKNSWIFLIIYKFWEANSWKFVMFRTRCHYPFCYEIPEVS
jgi:hypothetical protein